MPWSTEILQRPQGPPAQESTCTVLSMIQRRTVWMCCGQMWPKSSSLVTNQLAVFGGMFCLGDRTTALHQRDNGRGNVPSGPGHWSQPGHWKWVVDGYYCMNQNTWPRQQKSGSRRSTLRSWSGLTSLQTLIQYVLPNIGLKTLMTWRGSA